jgi:hypothetical protein
MGAMKIAYAPIKLRKVFPLLMIIQGHRAHPPRRIHMIIPRLMLIHFGHMVTTSRKILV